MDVLGTAWGDFMSSIQAGCLANQQLEDETKTFLDRLFNLLKKKSHLHWHIQYFELYITEKVCPLGLRVQLFPTIKDPSVDFKKSWENTLTNCSIELMSKLTTQYRSDMTSLDAEIDRLLNQFPNIQESGSFTNKWKEIRDKIESLNKDIITKKQRKFSQDKLAFTEGYAYKWSGKSSSYKHKRQNRQSPAPTATDYTESDSSISSVSSQINTRPTSSRAPGAPRKRSLTGDSSTTKHPKKGKQYGKALKTPQTPRPGVQTPSMGSLHPTLHNIIPKLLQPNIQTLLSQPSFLVQPGPEPSKQGNLDMFVQKTPIPSTSHE